MAQPIITLHSDLLHYRGVSLSNPHHAVVGPGLVAIVGANGSGKSTLCEIIEKGWNFRTNRISCNIDYPSIKKIQFSDIHSLSGMKVEYYQQRYESSMNDEVPTVGEIFAENIHTERWAMLCDLFKLYAIEKKHINFLSSGELRKLLIINALAQPVDVLILDNPYIGLDAPSRAVLNEALDALAAKDVTIILPVANPDDIPDHVNSIITMSNMEVGQPITDIPSIANMRQSLGLMFDYAIDMSLIPAPPTRDCEPLNTILKMENCCVKYGRQTVIDDISWEVADCQNWALTGPNGSGKSTLLSLICADNPQAYNNRLTLFDRRRGSGESIWDIKRRIGYISPEMSLHFNPAGNVATIVAQGLNDTTGVFITLKPGQLDLAMRWLNILHLEHLTERQFSTLSTGERQMVLLARTLIKQPRLLILDEPFHGLDYARARAIRAVINHLAARAKERSDLYPMTLIFVSHYASEMPECITFTKTLQKRQPAL